MIVLPAFGGFSFGEVEEILAALNRIAPDKRAAFRARLKHLQGLGFPPGANTGTGRRATYTFKMLLQMCLATELAQTGMAPKRIVQTVGGAWGDLENPFLLAMLPDDVRESLKTASSVIEDHLSDNRYTWIIRPEALRDLSTDGEREEDYCWGDPVPLSDLIQCVNAEEDWGAGELEGRRSIGEPHRHIIIQLKPLLMVVLDLVHQARPDIDLGDLGDEFMPQFEEELAETERGLEWEAKMAALIAKDPEGWTRWVRRLEEDGRS